MGKGGGGCNTGHGWLILRNDWLTDRDKTDVITGMTREGGGQSAGKYSDFTFSDLKVS